MDNNKENKKWSTSLKKNIYLAIATISVCIAVVLSGTALYSLVDNSGADGYNGGIIPLKLPSIISMAEASGVTNNSNGVSFLENEAGISAYTNVGEDIDLELVKDAFRTIEYETSEYIIGSVGLTDYTETEDVHCYIHRNGWIVSYYLSEEPTAKIIDWEDYTAGEIMGTKLDDGIVVVCNMAGVLPGEIMYYHFNYPNAEDLMIIAEACWGHRTDTFYLTLPSDFIFYERSYSHNSIHGACTMYIDEQQIDWVNNEETGYGLLSQSQLPSDEIHDIKLEHSSSSSSYKSSGAIVLIYREA